MGLEGRVAAKVVSEGLDVQRAGGSEEARGSRARRAHGGHVGAGVVPVRVEAPGSAGRLPATLMLHLACPREHERLASVARLRHGVRQQRLQPHRRQRAGRADNACLPDLAEQRPRAGARHCNEHIDFDADGALASRQSQGAVEYARRSGAAAPAWAALRRVELVAREGLVHGGVGGDASLLMQARLTHGDAGDR